MADAGPPRRTGALLADLRASAAAMAPAWAGPDAEGDFGAALYRIAARLGEQVTRRIALMPDRDRLAFFEALELPGAAPRAASVPLVLTLSDKRTTRVDAPAGLQVATKTGNIPFETLEALEITPARIATVIAADPAADRIEVAPAGVIAGKPRTDPPFTALTLSPAEPGSLTLQLSRTEGLASDDLLAVGDQRYRVAKASKGSDLVALQDVVTAAIAAGAPVRRIDDLEAFALRDLQQHSLYVAHKALLNLTHGGRITLEFDPPTLADRLPALGIRALLWGVAGTDTDPAWHPLDPAGAGGGRLVLRKAWPGSVEQLAVAGAKNRWLRIDLAQPIDPAIPLDTLARSLRIAVESDDGASAASAAPTITRACHNAVPLAPSGTFQPFGSEPQRFDTFAIAAPEALSKPGARVTLTITLADATPGAMAITAGRPLRGYAIGKDGAPYGITLPEQAATPGALPVPRWRGLTAPTEAVSGNPAKRVLLSGSTILAAVAISSWWDLVLANDSAGRLWAAYVSGGEPASALQWVPVAPASDAPRIDQTLIAKDGRCFLAVLDATGLSLTELGGSWAPGVLGGWTRAAADPALRFGTDARLGSPVGAHWPEASGMAAAAFALVDHDGDLWLGTLDIGTRALAWRNSLRGAARDVRPLLIEQAQGYVLVAAAAADRTVFALRIDGGGVQSLGTSDATAGAGSMLLPAPASAAGPLGIAIWGAAGLALWAPGYPVRRIDLSPEQASTGLLFAGGSGVPPSLLIAGSGEALLMRALPKVRTASGTLFDAVAAPFTATLAAVGAMPAPVYPVEATGIIEGTDELTGIAAGIVGDGVLVRLFGEAQGGLSATIAAGGTLELDPADTHSATGSYLVIADKLYHVTSLTAGMATLSPAPAGSAGDAVSYRTGSGSAVAPIAAAMRARLLRLPGLGSSDTLSFAAPATPGTQTLATLTGDWAKLAQPWTDPPIAAPAVLVASTVANDGWTATAFARNYQSPELSWEYSDGTSWRRIEKLLDGTTNLSRSGDVVFYVPTDLAETEVAGKKDLWVRARLIGGDYGRAKYEIVAQTNTATPPVTTQTISVNTQDLAPPEIVAIAAGFALTGTVDPQAVVTVNDLAVLDQTQAALSAGARFDIFTAIAHHVAAAAGGAGADAVGRCLYVMLDRAPDVAILTLFVDAIEDQAEDAALAVQQLRATGWADVDAFDDPTHGLLRSGLVRLPIGAGPAQLPLFGRTGWWLRLFPRPGGPADWQPRIRGLYLNAAEAVQARTRTQELVGSSDGSPGQSFALAEWPVLAGSLELRVRETLSEEEVAALEADAGARGAVAIRDAVPNIPGSWVLWRAVDAFAGQGADARVFRIDLTTGMLLFGDGRHGKVPPAGQDAIRAFAYRAGGGSIGNQPAGSVSMAKSAVQSLDAVTNPVPARGGVDVVAGDTRTLVAQSSRRDPRPYVAPDAAVQAAAVARVRDAGRIFAPVDVEAYVRTSAPDVAAVRCLRGDGGFRVLVALRDADVRAAGPSRARREGLASALAELGCGAVAAAAIDVRAPRFVRARIEATLRPVAPEQAVALDLAAQGALRDLLDPACGPGGDGGRFGQAIAQADVYRALAGLAGLDRIEAVTIVPVDAMPARLEPDMLVYGEDDDAVVTIALGAAS
ncbi:hypothetical protein [Sphingomonas sp. PAMC 26605]|uniref:hypothetical protein n=1 Tax=Sphingomonas sp. PAMC 26605 TaxID=1112214 RepID=UPI00026CCA49|nr:hypothetical protein [Sphingomonas sp. PAMC 26605]